ncbi:MAG: PspC domain-containing protein [Actinobacteria bacterium]|nr:MAG: PspC domain-containing protein [Actinomycetota bacterium]
MAGERHMGDDRPMETTTTSVTTGASWRRPREGRALAGVAAAAAEHTGIGVGWIRAGFIVATFFGGLGALLYAVGWLTIPDEGEERSIAGQMIVPLEARGSAQLVGAVLLTIAGLALLAAVDVLSARWVLIGGLAVLGVLLYRGEILAGPRPEPPPVTGTTATLALEPSSVEPPGEAEVEGGAVSSAPPRPRQRSLLGRLTLAAVLVALGTLGILAAADLVSVAPVHFAAAALGIIGLGLLIGSVAGRARWLAVIGVLLVPFVLVMDVLPTTWSSQVGERSYAPTSLVAGGDGYHLGAGTLRLDLTGLPASTEPIVAEVGAGELRILLPEGRGALIDAEVGSGELRVEGSVDRGGMALEETVTVQGPDPITIDAATGFGLLSITWEDE